MSEDLGFRLEKRGDVRVVVFDEGGVSPATVVSERLWDALQAATEREARLRQIAQDDRLSEFKKLPPDASGAGTWA